MPEWSGGNPDPIVEAENWAEAIGLIAEFAKDKPIDEVLEKMQAPEQGELKEAAIRAVAGQLAYSLTVEGVRTKNLPDPELLVKLLCIGVMAGAVYAVTNMGEAVVRMGQDEETNQEETASVTEDPA